MRVYDKRDDLKFKIVNLLYASSNVSQNAILRNCWQRLQCNNMHAPLLYRNVIVLGWLKVQCNVYSDTLPFRIDFTVV